MAPFFRGVDFLCGIYTESLVIENRQSYGANGSAWPITCYSQI